MTDAFDQPRRYRHTLGPVLSRRLGRSLSVDLMPFKTCSCDCLYCEQGRTTVPLAVITNGLNTVVRPPAERCAQPVPRERLELLATLFDPRAEVIADYRGPSQETDTSPETARALGLLARRPCSIREIAATLRLRPIETAQLVEHLASLEKVTERRFRDETFFSTVQENDTKEIG